MPQLFLNISLVQATSQSLSSLSTYPTTPNKPFNTNSPSIQLSFEVPSPKLLTFPNRISLSLKNSFLLRAFALALLSFFSMFLKLY